MEKPSPPQNLSTFAGRLAHLLAKNSTPAYRAGMAAGLSRQTVQKILANPETADDTVKLGTVRALASYFGCRPAWLAFGDGEE